MQLIGPQGLSGCRWTFIVEGPFPNSDSQCLIAPPYAFVCVYMLCGAYLGDKIPPLRPVIMTT